MLLGTPAHCIVGLPPPWPTYKGVTFLPVIEMVAERHMEGKHRLAPRMFAAECVRVFRLRGMKPAKRGETETVFHKINPVAYDVFYVYAALVKGNNPASQYFDSRYVLATHEIIHRVMSGGEDVANRISNEVCDAIEASL